MKRKVLILVPVYRPEPEHLVSQLRSIHLQTFAEFVCIVAFDGRPEMHLEERLADSLVDERFSLFGFDQRVGLYRHIERLLNQFRDVAEYVAFADQDDVWDADRIEKQVSILEKSQAVLVSDNARLVDSCLRSLDLNLFSALRISDESLKFGLVTTFATGAGTMYRATIIARALPFPKDIGSALHDHWLGCIGLVSGQCLLNSRPSWSYRQHGSNQIGAFRGTSSYRPFRAAFVKLLEIIFRSENRFERQVDIYLGELRKRFGSLPEGILDPASHIGVRDSLRLLTLSALNQSRLEALRVFFRRFSRL